jgi:excisionase family DNA binding protein
MGCMADQRQLPQQLKLPLVALEETLDVWTAARIARVSPETIRRWCDEGRITAYKLVGRWRIDREAFYAFLASCKAVFRTK